MTRILALGVATLMVGACVDTPVEPTAFEPAAPSLAPVGPAGNGVVFTTSPFVGISHADDDGDVCTVLNFETGAGDPSDWQRTNKHGKHMLHIVDAEASIDIVLASGDAFSGEGRWNVNWSFTGGTQVSTAVGTVQDAAGNTFRARCVFRRAQNLHRSIDVF